MNVHDEAVEALKACDPRLAAVIEKVGPCGLEVAADGTLFTHLARAIVFQQLSGKAAGTIHGRFTALFPDGHPTPEGVAGLSDEALRAVGLSRQKTASIRALAAHLAGRDLALTALGDRPDDAIIADLTQVKGIGRWTVEMMLLFRLGRPDVLAVDDLGIQRGIQHMYGLAERPKPKAVGQYGQRWAPWRSVASWYLWRAADLRPEDLP